MRFAGLFLMIFLLAPAPGFGAEHGELVKIVVLSRHGVRSPTQDKKILSMWSQKTWPVWPVARGELTPRGARLVTAMWTSLKSQFEERGLLPRDGCPKESAIFVRADVDERTRATAAAILEGLAPGCKLGFAVSKEKIDPLFHPVKAGLYRYDAIPAATDILSMTRGGLERLQDELAGPLALLSEINGPPASNLCSRFALMPKCQIEDLPNAISVSADGSSIRLVGGLGVASSLAEIFLLEYGEWPNEDAGWGQVDGRVLSQILPLHSKVFDVVNRAPVVAWANGSSLLREMTAALFNRHFDPRANEARLVIFVGHDTNIANIGGILGFNWDSAGYPPDGIPPAGALFLELWQRDGRQEIVAKFLSQPPAALHAAFEGAPKSDAKEHAPKSAPVTWNGSPARMSGAAFSGMVSDRTEGAPIAPEQKPAFEYGVAN